MKKLLLITLLLSGLFGIKPVNAHTVTGTIYDKSDNTALPGVSVQVQGTNSGTQSNAAGIYSINVPDGKQRLKFSFIGYKSLILNTEKAGKLNVYLEASSSNLNEVVVTGYSAPQQKSITSSVATINPGYLNAQPAQGLQERAAGIIISKPAMAKVRSNNIYLPSSTNSGISNDESYKGINENTFNDVKGNPLSTFSIDVDAASYSNVRRFINNGQLPPPDAVRIEEMVNYFKYDLAAPANNNPVAIHTELSATPWNPHHRLLRIGLKAKTIEADKLPPSNLVFLIDVSGSMDEPNKLPLVKSAMKMLVEQLRAKDKVAIVTYAGQAGILLGSTSGDEKETINTAIDNLNAGGSTAGGDGIRMAYQVAKKNFMSKGNNRIIMATDGDFNVGPNSDEDMEHLITRERDSKVAISIMGFGMGNLKDSKMETLADKGNGNYAYIDNVTEAHKALVSEFGGTLFTVAKDVKIQVEFNPAKVKAYRLLGYEDRMLNKEDFNNDKKDAGEMGSGHTVTALYEIIPAGVYDEYTNSVDPLKYQKVAPTAAVNNSDEMMTIKFRYKINDSAASKMEYVTVKDQPKEFKSTTADFRFAAAVAEFGMLLRDSQFKQASSYDQVINIAKTSKGNDEEGYRSEFVRLAESAKLLAKSSLAAK